MSRGPGNYSSSSARSTCSQVGLGRAPGRLGSGECNDASRALHMCAHFPSPPPSPVPSAPAFPPVAWDAGLFVHASTAHGDRPLPLPLRPSIARSGQRMDDLAASSSRPCPCVPLAPRVARARARARRTQPCSQLATRNSPPTDGSPGRLLCFFGLVAASSWQTTWANSLVSLSG